METTPLTALGPTDNPKCILNPSNLPETELCHTDPKKDNGIVVYFWACLKRRHVYMAEWPCGRSAEIMNLFINLFIII